MARAFKCACQRSPSDSFEGLKSFFSVSSDISCNVAEGENRVSTGHGSQVCNGSGDNSRVEQNGSTQLIEQNVSTLYATGGFNSVNYSVFVSGNPSHSCFEPVSLSLPATRQPRLLEFEAPLADTDLHFQLADSKVVCEMRNRSFLPQDFSSASSDVSLDSLESSDMSHDGCHDPQIDLNKCPLCFQTFDLADLSDVPAPHNFGLSRHLDYARRRITKEVYLAGHESELEPDHACHPDCDHGCDHSSSERPIVPETHNSRLVARGIFAGFFEVFTHRILEASPEYAFLAPQDMRSVSALSLQWFVSLQPALRVRRWRAVAGAADSKATLFGNVDLIKFDKGVVYKCNLCYRLYAVVVPGAVCACLLCDTCHRVKPRNVAWFNNQTYVCKCPWEYSFAESYNLRTGLSLQKTR